MREPPELSIRQAIADALATGESRSSIARRLGLGKSTVAYHARRLEQPSNPRCGRRYDWSEVQRYYDAGHSVSDCQAQFGFARAAWAGAVERGAVVPRPRAMPLERLLAETPRGRWNLKRRLIAAGIKEDRCEECGIAEWRGRPITLALHHRNGRGDDNRLENLALLCPNCHSQTENFAGRNLRKARAA
jgi:transposase-like protein